MGLLQVNSFKMNGVGKLHLYFLKNIPKLKTPSAKAEGVFFLVGYLVSYSLIKRLVVLALSPIICTT